MTNLAISHNEIAPPAASLQTPIYFPTRSTQNKRVASRNMRLRPSPSPGVADLGQEMESEKDSNIEPLPSRKRKAGSQTRLEPQEQSSVQDSEEAAPRKKIRFSGKQTLKTICKPSANDNHIILASEMDSNLFFYMLYYPGINMSAIRNLEIHLDATKTDEYANYRLALALMELHPRVDGTNPHIIQSIKLVVDGNLLFTRHRYHLTSRAASESVKKNKRRFLAGNLTIENKKRFPYKTNCTETVVAKALLGIRGIEQVVIDGEGKMEESFAETLKSTLIQPPGTVTVRLKDIASRNPLSGTNDVQEDESGEDEVDASLSHNTRRFASRNVVSPVAVKGKCINDNGFTKLLKIAVDTNLPLVVIGEEDDSELGWSLEVKMRV